MDVGRFKKLPILGILRCSANAPVEGLVEAVVSSGLETIEITMNSVGAADLIRRAVKASGKRLAIGAGTVLTTDILKEALDAGASFIVMPMLAKDVLDSCVRQKIPAFPGAFTPQEVYNAWDAGATMVKVFPAAMFGPAYIKELKAPFDKIELLACGGITPDNIKLYFQNGASAVAFGGSVFKKEWLEKHDFESIRHSIRNLIDHAK